MSIPTCTGQGGVYPRMLWAEGCVSQHALGRGSVCPGGCAQGVPCRNYVADGNKAIIKCVNYDTELRNKQISKFVKVRAFCHCSESFTLTETNSGRDSDSKPNCYIVL